MPQGIQQHYPNITNLSLIPNVISAHRMLLVLLCIIAI